VTDLEFGKLLARLGTRLRLRRAASGTLPAIALVLGAAVVLVVALKLAGLEGAGPVSILTAAGAIFAAAVAAGIGYVLNPVSELRAAAELDRLAGLKERAASLVALRRGGGPVGQFGEALRADARRALAEVDASEVAGRAAPLPGGARWPGLLLLALMVALLVPARGGGRSARMIDMLVEGDALLRTVGAAGEVDGPATPQAETARKVLTIIKAPPPADPEQARRNRKELKDLAAELKKRGAREAAERLEAAVRALGGVDQPKTGDGSGSGDGAGRRPTGSKGYPVRYRELLARYFAADS
jgi:hypothetical protein